jgi:hypothetical protein
MNIGFADGVLLFGALLAVVAALSGVMRGTVLSASVLSVALGMGLAGAGVISADATSRTIVELIELALVVRPQRLFIAWFGPKGVASMLFALLVLKSAVENGELIFDVAAITVIASIVAHGLTDTLGARWIRRRTLRIDSLPSR